MMTALALQKVQVVKSKPAQKIFAFFGFLENFNKVFMKF